MQGLSLYSEKINFSREKSIDSFVQNPNLNDEGSKLLQQSFQLLQESRQAQKIEFIRMIPSFACVEY